MIDTNETTVSFAIEAVRRACRMVRLVQAQMVTPALTKEDRSPVTIADFASQAVVAQALAERMPLEKMVGEEDASALRAPDGRDTLSQITDFVRRQISDADAEKVLGWIDRGGAQADGRYWTLDPIDGTKGFLRGDQYAIALALIENGKVHLGVLGCPNLGDGYRPDFNGPGSLLVAQRGKGAWLTTLEGETNYRQLSVSARKNPVEARLLRSYESGHTNVDKIDEFAAAMQVKAEPVRMDSQAKYAVLAAGQGEVILRLLSPKAPDYKEKIWDQAAGSIIVEEAGGTVSDLHGRPLDFTAGRTLAHNRGLCVTNGLLHSTALSALAQIGA